MDDQGDAEADPCVRQHNVADSHGWVRMGLAAVVARHCAGRAASEAAAAAAAADACRRELE